MPVHLLYRTRYTPEQLKELVGEIDGMRSALEAEHLGAPISVWHRYDLPEAYLVVLEYADLATASQGFETFTTLASHVESAGFRGQGAPDVMMLEVVAHAGVNPVEAPPGALFSLSLRNAEPGYVQELLDDLDIIFRELEPIGGLLGWSYGQRVNSPEEVLGIGLWQNFSDYETSLPMSPKLSELRVYKRVL